MEVLLLDGKGQVCRDERDISIGDKFSKKKKLSTCSQLSEAMFINAH